MSGTLSYLSSCFIGADRGYIYVLYSKNQHALYVGQTNDRAGTIGRLNAHISINGTFRIRLLEKEGVGLDEIDDLHMFSFSLPKDPRFTGLDRSYREGVEYLVQKHLHSVRGSLRPFMRIVSNVEYNDTAQLTLVQSTALEVFNEFLRTFS
jgi:hypothetical protein